MHRTIRLCMSLVMLTGIVALTAGANIISNPGFENDLTDWSFEVYSPAEATAAASAESVHSGGKALKVAVTNPPTSGWHLALARNNLSVTQGTTYMFSI